MVFFNSSVKVAETSLVYMSNSRTAKIAKPCLKNKQQPMDPTESIFREPQDVCFQTIAYGSYRGYIQRTSGHLLPNVILQQGVLECFHKASPWPR